MGLGIIFNCALSDHCMHHFGRSFEGDANRAQAIYTFNFNIVDMTPIIRKVLLISSMMNNKYLLRSDDETSKVAAAFNYNFNATERWLIIAIGARSFIVRLRHRPDGNTSVLFKSNTLLCVYPSSLFARPTNDDSNHRKQSQLFDNFIK